MHMKILLFSCVIHHTVISVSHVAEDLLTGEEPVQTEEMGLKFNSDFFFSPPRVRGALILSSIIDLAAGAHY